MWLLSLLKVIDKSRYLELGMLIDSQADDVIGVFQVKRLDPISRAQYNSCPCGMVHNFPFREVVQIISGVKSTIAVNEI